LQDKVRIGVAEDRFTGAIESQTSKIPSSGYLAAAFGAITASAILKIVGKDDWELFVGQWPAAFRAGEPTLLWNHYAHPAALDSSLCREQNSCHKPRPRDSRPRRAGSGSTHLSRRGSRLFCKGVSDEPNRGCSIA
jgi:hypothetical protein